MCSGVGMVLCGDVWLQLERKGDISIVTKPFIAIFVVNILLWIDFNITIVRRKKKNEPGSSQLRSQTHIGHDATEERYLGWVVGHLLIGHLLPPIFGQLLPPILGQLLPLILGQLLLLILGHLLPLFIKRESTSTTCPTTHPTSSRRPWTRPPSSIKPLGLCNDRIYLDTFKCMSVWNVA